MIRLLLRLLLILLAVIAYLQLMHLELARGATVTIINPYKVHEAPDCVRGRLYRTPWGETVFTGSLPGQLYRLCYQSDGAPIDREALEALPLVGK